MNDLSGLSWDSAPAKPGTSNNRLAGSHGSSSSLRPIPSVSPAPIISRQTSPLSAAHSGRDSTQNAGTAAAASKSGHASDSFSNLLGPSVAKKPSSNTLTLSERQRQLAEEKARQAAAQRERDNAVWETLEKGRSSTPLSSSSLGQTNTETKNTSKSNKISSIDPEDILSAFSASAPVDASSHFPPPISQTNGSSTSGIHTPSIAHISPGPIFTPPVQDNDLDDLFGPGSMPHFEMSIAKALPAPIGLDDDDEDILGELGKPISAAKKPQPSMDHGTSSETPPAAQMPARTSEHPQDQAVAEIVDMGFPIERARVALYHTDTGVDVQAAVGWLLSQAHQESRAKSGGTPDSTGREPRNGSHRSQSGRRAQDAGASEVDVAQMASEFGNSFFKSANKLWKSGQKRVQKAMAEFQYEGDPNQPKWMIQDGQTGQRAHRQTPPVQAESSGSFTNEAAMLESGRSRAVPREQSGGAQPSNGAAVDRGQPNGKLAPSNIQMQNEAQQLRSSTSSPISRPASRLTREAVESQSAEAYISPARRKKATPAPAPAAKAAPPEEPTLDIFSSSLPPTAPAKPTGPANQPKQSSTPKPSASSTARSKLVSRNVPDVSAAVLSTSALHRQKGTESFKRGDFAEAHHHYSAALSPIPANHPTAIVLRCNRALTAIKTGDPKAAITDADAALAAIGPSNGEGESISLGEGEADKPMKEFFGKALMRKAEALENMEKWSDAAKVYRQAVEAGVGGAPAIQGRTQCEKAAAAQDGLSSPAPPAAATAKRAPARRPAQKQQRSALGDLSGGGGGGAGGGGGDSEAVKRLRAANAAAAAASDEAFALNDSVEARLTAWKSGKEGNLRALLASLDAVLWAGAGWTKVGMSDLVLPPRVKIVYMKAIAKCHPDKIPTDATTEQKMISASVFATLNEAWDKFKKDNGL